MATAIEGVESTIPGLPRLRPYQTEAGRAIVYSVLGHRGLTFTSNGQHQRPPNAYRPNAYQQESPRRRPPRVHPLPGQRLRSPPLLPHLPPEPLPYDEPGGLRALINADRDRKILS